METTCSALEVAGTRSDLVRELQRLADGWYHLGKDERRAECLLAALRLERGDLDVKAGHTLYRVTGATEAG